MSVVERWAGNGMPVRREVRYVETTVNELNEWLEGEQSGKPAHVVTDETDLGAELKGARVRTTKEVASPA